MKRKSQKDAELDELVTEMDRVEEAMARDLGEEFSRVDSEGRLHASLAFVRLQIQAWGATAARRGRHDPEALAVTMAGIEHMDRDELAAMIGRLVRHGETGWRAPAA